MQKYSPLNATGLLWISFKKIKVIIRVCI